MTKDQAIKHLKLMQSGARNAIRFKKNDKEISEEERKEDIEIYQDQLEALNLATNALEQQPSEDCVSRKEVLKLFQALKDDGGIFAQDYVENAINNNLSCLPPVTPTQRWIPVSERLPEKQGDYLCSLYYAVPPYNVFHPEKDIYIHDVSVKKFDGKSFISSVKAWQPLPKPYEEKRGDSDGSIHA